MILLYFGGRLSSHAKISARSVETMVRKHTLNRINRVVRLGCLFSILSWLMTAVETTHAQEPAYISIGEFFEIQTESALNCIGPRAPGECNTVAYYWRGSDGRVTTRMFTMQYDPESPEQDVVVVIDWTADTFNDEVDEVCYTEAIQKDDLKVRYYKWHKNLVAFKEGSYEVAPDWYSNLILGAVNRRLKSSCSRYAIADQQFDGHLVILGYTYREGLEEQSSHVIYPNRERRLRLSLPAR